MKTKMQIKSGLVALALAAAAPLASGHTVQGVEGSTTGCAAGVNRCFTLHASSGSIVTGDGNSLPFWGYGIVDDLDVTPTLQYPGPTLIARQDEVVSITLTNALPLPVSIVLPGQTGVTATGGTLGLLTREIGTTGSVTYTFTAGRPGTFQYSSGTRPELEVEFGLTGALVVRPTGFVASTPAVGTTPGSPGNMTAYGADSTRFEHEFLYVLTEMDRTAHEQLGDVMVYLADPVNAGQSFDQAVAALRAANPVLPDGATFMDPATFKSVLWFMNGRNGPDSLSGDNVGWLPNQPYSSVARVHPADRVLMRLVGGGRDLHPFHHHGNNAWMVAKNAHVLQSAGGTVVDYPDHVGVPGKDPVLSASLGIPLDPEVPAGGEKLPDLALSDYTIQTVPGSTYDAIFTWTGRGLGWDAYGHQGTNGVVGAGCDVAMEPNEDPADHCRKFTQTGGALPVTLPEQQALTFGGFWSGGPYLGGGVALPPGEGGLNPNSGFTFMWHSHTERELTNDDIFPGGMMTMLIVDPPSSDAD
ncbi:MAG: multicopper oxidase domain-containing protein [Gammaproteobacteria bacterium]|nr:multicopper oxidase domain-containing protein [Gammaproteobacteria bacterium]